MSKIEEKDLEKGFIGTLSTGKKLNINPQMNEGFTREDHLSAVSFYKSLTDHTPLTPSMLVQMNKNLNVHNNLADKSFIKNLQKSEDAEGSEEQEEEEEEEENEDGLEKGENGPTFEQLESMNDLEGNQD